MQFGAQYIGRSFKLIRPHHISPTESFREGMVGVMKAVDIKSTSLLLEFQISDPPRPAKAWINENNIKLEDAPAAAPAPAEPETFVSFGPAEGRSFKHFYEKGMKPVQSSTIESVGLFSPQAQDIADKGNDSGDLVVKFKNGGAYIIEGVMASVFEGIFTAASAGKAYDQLVKKDPALKSLVKKLGA